MTQTLHRLDVINNLRKDFYRWNYVFLSALNFRTAVKAVRKNFPVSSYSSSDDDDDFFDADETMEWVIRF